MTKENYLCPSSDNGNHRYFIFKTVDYYEPVVLEVRHSLSPTEVYYKKVEYAQLGCNCGSVVRQEVKHL